jgi:hypothetical protein
LPARRLPRGCMRYMPVLSLVVTVALVVAFTGGLVVLFI